MRISMSGYVKTLALAVLLALSPPTPAFAQAPGAALQSGDGPGAARAFLADLTEAIAHSGARLYADDVADLETDLARELAPVAALSQQSDVEWRAQLVAEWRENAGAPRNDGRTACGGFVPLGAAAVTSTATSRSSVRGMSRLSCAVSTRTDDEFGWTGIAAASAGQGALLVRFQIASEDASIRALAGQHLARALERVAAALRPLNRTAPTAPDPDSTT